MWTLQNFEKRERLAIAVGLIALALFGLAWVGWVDDDVAQWSLIAILAASHFIKGRSLWFAAMRFFVPLALFYLLLLLLVFFEAGANGWDGIILMVLAAIFALHFIIGIIVALVRRAWGIAALGAVALLLVSAPYIIGYVAYYLFGINL